MPGQYSNNWRAKIGDHFVICDICGTKRYRSQCDWTWDGFLACHINRCWYPKDELFIVPPVINDPYTLYDVRPDIAVAQRPSVPPFDTRQNWGELVDTQNYSNNPPKWNQVTSTQSWGQWNAVISYISGLPVSDN